MTITNKFLAAAALGLVLGVTAPSASNAATLQDHAAGQKFLIDVPFAKELLINREENKPLVLSCLGCISSVTGLPRTNYVSPHYRSNGTYVDGYYRSQRW